MVLSRAKRLLLGEPLTLARAHEEQIPKWKALATLSSDALSSVAYATEAILLVLIAVSTSVASWSIPLAFAITLLLTILAASYWQTIENYPNGGGAYTVAKENLGMDAGLVAGAAILIDYILTVAVSVSSGVENIASAVPELAQHRNLLAAGVVFLLMVMNLRGIRESATFFAFPTYFFVGSVLLMVVVGLYRVSVGEIPAAGALNAEAFAPVSILLLLRAFGAGCSALTGVEAISNGVQVFRPPCHTNAKVTLVLMAGILAALFIGITTLAHVTGIVPGPHQTLISLLGRHVFGDSVLYYFLQACTASILFLAANTAYVGFPKLASMLAQDRYLPRQLASVGDRLVFSNGIMGLSMSAFFLIWLFNGETQRLLPLYAIGVFLSFTLSQAGMVIHHLKERKAGMGWAVFINALGATTTAVVLIDISATRFLHGAWVVVIAIPFFVMLFRKVQKHYLDVGRALTLIGKTPPKTLEPVKHTVVVPISGIHQGVLEALRYALSISSDVRACYVELDSEATERTKAEWERWVHGVPFVVLKSPYRSVIQPLIAYIDDVEEISHDDVVTVVIPEFVTSKWWHRILHNQTALFIRAALAFKRGKIVTSVRYHINVD